MTVDVAACVVRGSDGRILLAERTARQVGPGYWELPGGKIDPGESAPQAAARELREEIGIEARSLTPSLAYEYAFKSKRVRLHFFRVDEWTGNAHGREGQRLAWVDPAAPSVGPILPSNERVLLALGLPSVCIRSSLERLPHELAAGARFILLDEPGLPAGQRVTFLRRAVASARPFAAHVLHDGPASEARLAEASGVLTSPAALRRLASRPGVRLWAAACSDAPDAARAVELGADILVVAADLGAQIVATSPLPAYVRCVDRTSRIAFALPASGRA